MDIFPIGVAHYLAGGILLGVAVSAIYVLTAYIVGASAILDSINSFFSSRFPPKYRGPRLAFGIGIVAGGAAYAMMTGDMFLTAVQPWRLLLGGVFIGLGARLGRGCTSGHGICGLASLSPTSFINVVTFVLVAIGTAFMVRSFGVVP